MKVKAIVDLQFGSTGKGLIAGHISRTEHFDTVVSANMPNAGHTYVDDEGNKTINKVLPSGVLSPKLRYIMIGPGAIFQPNRLVAEINELRQRGVTAEVCIHEHAGIVLPEHKQAEEEKLSVISSTMQGSMEAIMHKLRRNPGNTNIVNRNGSYLNVETSDGHTLYEYITSHEKYMEIMYESESILVEGSQGYSLGINAGFWPHCTSRDCTVWRTLADCAVPVPNRYALTVVGTARVHPIRVGNTSDGNSGPCYDDQRELTWERLGVSPEHTTVTGRVRRVFTFSSQQIHEAMRMNSVNEVFLNFCNYDPREANRVRGVINDLGKTMCGISEYEALLTNFNMVRYLGFGPQDGDIMEIGTYANG